MKKPVVLTIHSEQRYEGQDVETIELVTDGELERIPDGWRVSYLESDLSGLQGATTTFVIQPGQVTLERSGSLQSKMVFQERVRHESLYQMDVGALMIGVCARKIETDLSWEGGRMNVVYAIQIEQTQAGTISYCIDVKPA